MTGNVNYVWRLELSESNPLKEIMGPVRYFFDCPNNVLLALYDKSHAELELARLRKLGVPVLEEVPPYSEQDSQKGIYLGGLG